IRLLTPYIIISINIGWSVFLFIFWTTISKPAWILLQITRLIDFKNRNSRIQEFSDLFIIFTGYFIFIRISVS
uniref:DUF3397 family protein n=1 Tax=Schistosoma curassoni TaxID=6186 RepID=A0A183JFV8_9TREM